MGGSKTPHVAKAVAKARDLAAKVEGRTTADGLSLPTGPYKSSRLHYSRRPAKVGTKKADAHSHARCIQLCTLSDPPVRQRVSALLTRYSSRGRGKKTIKKKKKKKKKTKK